MLKETEGTLRLIAIILLLMVFQLGSGPFASPSALGYAYDEIGL